MGCRVDSPGQSRHDPNPLRSELEPESEGSLSRFPRRASRADYPGERPLVVRKNATIKKKKWGVENLPELGRIGTVPVKGVRNSLPGQDISVAPGRRKQLVRRKTLGAQSSLDDLLDVRTCEREKESLRIDEIREAGASPGS